jgi:hypothetical protein
MSLKLRWTERASRRTIAVVAPSTDQHDREADLDYSCAYPLRPQALSPQADSARCPETGAFRNEPAVCTSRFGVVPTRRVAAIKGSVRHAEYI